MKTKDLKIHFLPEKKKGSKDAAFEIGRWGFMAPELAQIAYAAFSALLILFTWTGIDNASALLWERLSFLSGTLALWVVYWLWPCRFVVLCRISYMLLMLASWYPDTYELNKQFACHDHLVAEAEQALFGCQPTLLFSQQFASKVVSELMYFGYYSYYLFFVVTLFVIYFRHYRQLERAALLVFGGFFLCYCIYDVLPVTGPQYYYLAAGMENVAQGVFPDVGHFFAHSTEAVTLPGWQEGIFYQLVHANHQIGERPTAAFPSSHVAIATVVMLMVICMRMWKYALVLAVPYLLLCLSTVYIMAHYAIDSIAGFLTGIALFFLFKGHKLHY